MQTVQTFNCPKSIIAWAVLGLKSDFLICVYYYNITSCTSRTCLVLVVLFCTQASYWVFLLVWFWFWTGLVVFLCVVVCKMFLQYQGCCCCFNAVQGVTWARPEADSTVPASRLNWHSKTFLISSELYQRMEFTPALFIRCLFFFFLPLSCVCFLFK